MEKPFKEFTYREIKEYAKEKSNSIIQKAISKFIEENLIDKKKIGNMFLYRLNTENNTVFSYFEILAKERLSISIKKTLIIIQKELKGTNFISIIIFGSFAEGKQTQKSDLDIAVFVTSEEDKRKCKLSLKSAELKSVLVIDHHIFTQNEMLLMLKDKHENLGKQIAYKHIAVHNPMIFYSIIQEGIDNGFKIIYS